MELSRSRTPSWGAWIEMLWLRQAYRESKVAPPRGVRGLKYRRYDYGGLCTGRTPSWGAWIEIEKHEG